MKANMRRQSGVVLVIGLIFLMVLTLIGISGTQTSSLQEKMAGNMRDNALAFQAAEAALKAGEHFINKTSSMPAFDCTSGFYMPRDVDCNPLTVEKTDVWDNAAIWADDNKSIRYNTDGDLTTIDLGSLGDNPRYIVEKLAAICEQPKNTPCHDTYRITARAVGLTADSVVMLQSVYSPS